MNHKLKIMLGSVVILCIVILIIDAFVFFFSKKNSDKKTYFDSINSFEILDGAYIAVGSNNNNEDGFEKAKITLYDESYNKKWEKLYNNKYNSSYFSVKKDDDSYIAVGSIEKNKKEHEEGVRSALIVKYDSNGEKLVENTFQVLGNSKFTNVVVVDDGYLVVGQSIYEKMTLGFSDEGGGFLIKYDKNLKEVSRSNYGGSKSGLYQDILIDGEYIYTVGKDASNVGIVSKYTLDLERVHTINYEYTDSFGFTGVVSDGNYLYVVGGKKVKEDKQDYDTDALLVKYDFDLNKKEEVIFRKDGMERYNRVLLDDKQNIVIAGQTGVYNKKKSTAEENVFSYDGILAKYDTNLKEQFVEIYGNEQDDYFTDIKLKKNGYLVSGYSTYDEYSYVANFIHYNKSGKLLGGK